MLFVSKKNDPPGGKSEKPCFQAEMVMGGGDYLVLVGKQRRLRYSLNKPYDVFPLLTICLSGIGARHLGVVGVAAVAGLSVSRIRTNLRQQKSRMSSKMASIWCPCSVYRPFREFSCSSARYSMLLICHSHRMMGNTDPSNLAASYDQNTADCPLI